MKKNVSKKQIALILVAVCLVGLIGIGFSYSYFLANISTSKEENKNSNISTTTITQVVMDMQGKISSDGAYPGHKMVKEVVVRGIGADNATPANASIQITPDLGDFANDVTWRVYKSDTPITCTSTKHVDGGQFYEEASCNLPDSATLELEGSSVTKYKNIVVSPNTKTKYYLVVEYLNKTYTDQSSQMGKSFSIDIGLGEKQFTPLEKIVASVDTTGKCPTINDDGTVNVTSVEATNGYLCSAEDAYGTSYYYRGNVTNNYVKFADKYWRIVRINGDGTVRVIYDGTSAHVNGESSTDRQIGTSEFNISGDDNAYIGYMYGDREFTEDYYPFMYWYKTESHYVAKEYTFNESNKTFTLKDPISILVTDLTDDYIGYYTVFDSAYGYSGVQQINEIFDDGDKFKIDYTSIYVGSTSKEAAQTNTNSSTIKTYLDNWYKNNILGTDNEQYVADNIFCNDRTTSGGGYGRIDTDYHWYGFPASKSNLKCTQQNDAFTVSDTTYGNGALTYPIGLISTDEAVLAGGYSTSNSGYYLYSGSSYWTSSPSDFHFDHLGSYVREVSNDGDAYGYATTNNDIGVRLVFNLKADILSQGSGTAEDPYHIS